MEAHKLKKKQKKLDDARRQRRQFDLEQNRERCRIEWMEKKLALADEARRKKQEVRSGARSEATSWG